MNYLNDKTKKSFEVILNVSFPEWFFRKQEDEIFNLTNQNKDIYQPLYDYDEKINFCFARFHFYLNQWITECSRRVRKGNTYVTVSLKDKLDNFIDGIKILKNFFEKNNLVFSLNESYKNMLDEFTHLKKEPNTNKFCFDDYQVFPDLIKDEPIFFLSSNKEFKPISYLIFGASKTKPYIIAKNLLDGDLQVINDTDVLVYDKEISDSVLYSDFNQWWQANSQKYSWYKPKNDMNEIEYKVQQYYITNYKKDENPVIIPQVYVHYDPHNKKMKEMYGEGKILTFQRMDFLIIYKGKRVIIEIDGKEHTQEENLEKYSKQCKYDREMKFMGYDVFRLGGYELTYSFDETIKKFFEQLAEYLNISHI